MYNNRNNNLNKSSRSPIALVEPLPSPVFIVEALADEGPDVYLVEKAHFIGRCGGGAWLALQWVMGELQAVDPDSVAGVYNDLRAAWAELGGWGKPLRFIEADTWNEIEVPGAKAGASSLKPTDTAGRRKKYLERYADVVQAFVTHGDSIRGASARTARAKSVCEKVRNLLIFEGRVARARRNS